MEHYPSEPEIRSLFSTPLWFQRLVPILQQFEKDSVAWNPNKLRTEKDRFFGIVENLLATNSITLAETGPNWDEERQPIDTIVIHHTHHQPGITWQRLNAIQLIRLYAGSYAAEQRQEEIFSHHFRGKQMVFYAYHWLVRMDGSIERLLHDEEIGWQAGDWEINRRSVAICLDNTFDHGEPSPDVLEAIARLIRRCYAQVQPERIYGHHEINPRTSCPGQNFLHGWKKSLLTHYLKNA